MYKKTCRKVPQHKRDREEVQAWGDALLGSASSHRGKASFPFQSCELQVLNLFCCLFLWVKTEYTELLAEIWVHLVWQVKKHKQPDRQETNLQVSQTYLEEKMKVNCKIITQTVVNIPHSLQTNCLLQLWPTVLGAFVWANSFPACTTVQPARWGSSDKPRQSKESVDYVSAAF